MRPIEPILVFLAALDFGCRSRPPAPETGTLGNKVEVNATTLNATGKQEAAWSGWSDVEAAILDHSNQPVAVQRTLLARAFDFCLEQRDFLRARFVNEQLYPGKSSEDRANRAYNEGVIAKNQQRFLETEQAWLQAMNLAPQNQQYRKSLGMLYANFGHFLKALPLLKELPKDPQVELTLAVVERQLGLGDSADTRCYKLIDQTPTDPLVLYNCSLMEIENHHNPAKALQWLEIAKEHLPQGSPLGEKINQQIASLHELKN